MKKTMLSLLAVGLLIATPSCKKGENDPFLSLKSRKGRITAEWTIASYVNSWSSTSVYEDDPNTDGDLIKNESEGTMTFESGVISSTSKSTNTFDSAGNGSNNTTSSVTETVASGSTVTQTSTNVGTTTISQTSTGSYAGTGDWKITFVKDGTFTMTKTTSTTKTYTDDSNADYTQVDKIIYNGDNTITGTWSFLSKNKSDEFKNKERIGLWYKSVQGTDVNEDDTKYTDKISGDIIDWTNFDNNNKSTSTTNYSDVNSSPDEIWELDMLKGKEVTAVRSYSGTSKGKYENASTSGGTTITTSSSSDYTNSGTTTMTLTRD